MDATASGAPQRRLCTARRTTGPAAIHKCLRSVASGRCSQQFGVARGQEVEAMLRDRTKELEQERLAVKRLEKALHGDIEEFNQRRQVGDTSALQPCSGVSGTGVIESTC